MIPRLLALVPMIRKRPKLNLRSSFLRVVSKDKKRIAKLVTSSTLLLTEGKGEDEEVEDEESEEQEPLEKKGKVRSLPNLPRNPL